MFTIEAERNGLKEQTLKKCVLQGKIKLTVNIKNFFKKVEEEEERKKWDIPSQKQTLRKKKKQV